MRSIGIDIVIKGQVQLGVATACFRVAFMDMDRYSSTFF